MLILGDPIGLLWHKLRIFFTVDRNAHFKLTNEHDLMKNIVYNRGEDMNDSGTSIAGRLQAVEELKITFAFQTYHH